ncbi:MULTISPECIES: ABC-F family ATP-binding cassette domain-containing protein [Paenibacillus]|uniref:ABC-F family ATP-binding cassette domain-containing protein n=1 Tax=Paenibacillus TaxID=44249 RepID=UPI0007BF413D|nr:MULTISPECIES: ABC-F family ATP-binding cassette domain-containing protein [Paenibacillus]MCZ1263496.1 ABC transporter ATP-binding protein [Paenibacillus tundrae]OAX50510.1 putative ABC transporter ATP-binding protein YheS [Paenibacillus sp. AD87]WDQ34869.1 ABC-F family ATP-binding cassette domain-containing protein [Paenibacillus marchantiae]SDL26347.1 ATP-binding cassette, subfamily F, member 3 [Paenibacillus sp. OK060]SHN74169.1 ATP-binding cassette, subfamily F, member 3 [Paenibacillus s
MLLQVSGIIKRFGVDPILDGVNLQILERERIGLVGVNGAGKSTLLKIVAGEMSYDGGQIFKSKETTLGYLAQNSGLQSDRSIWEEMMNVFGHLTQAEADLRQMEQDIADPAQMEDEKKYADLLERYAKRSDWFKDHGGYEMETRIRSVLHGMGFGEFSPDTQIATLSGGQKTRLALARILLQAPDLLMLDEPTNYLDIATLTWLEDYLRGYSGALLVVSHDRYFLDRLVTNIVEIERHRSKKYTGNYSRYMELKAAEYESQMKQYEKQQDEISKMEEFVQKNIVRASTTKRAQSRRKALDKMDRLDKPMGDLKKAHFSFEPAVMSGKEVLRVDQLSVAYDEASPLFRNVSFDLRRGETVALIGPNGIGKSTLLKCLTGSLRPVSGEIQWGTKVQIGYYDQEQTGLNPSNTVLEELWSAYPGMEESRIRTVLGNFLFSGDDVLKKISSLSGGEKARVSLSKLMLKEANMLILDEPTNHLDLFAKEVLEAALMDYEGTLLFISHDRYFLNKMAERIVELHPGGTEHYLGNYDDYVEKKQELEDIAREAAEARQASNKNSAKSDPGLSATEKSGAASFEADKQAKREERNRQRKQEALEQQIAKLETEITELEAQMALPEIYQDYMKLQELQEKAEDHKLQLAKAYEEWEELALE